MEKITWKSRFIFLIIKNFDVIFFPIFYWILIWLILGELSLLYFLIILAGSLPLVAVSLIGKAINKRVGNSFLRQLNEMGFHEIPVCIHLRGNIDEIFIDIYNVVKEMGPILDFSAKKKLLVLTRGLGLSGCKLLKISFQMSDSKDILVIIDSTNPLLNFIESGGNIKNVVSVLNSMRSHPQLRGFADRSRGSRT